MQSWILIFALAALILDSALTLPVKLDDSEEVAASDDQLLKILGGKSMETESESLEHSPSHHREVRAAGPDTSSASSEESQEKVPKDNERGSSNSGSSEENTEKPGASAPARKKRSTLDDLVLAAFEAEAIAKEANVDESSVDDNNVDEPNELDVENNHEDYAQGCEVLEENSKEANNETFSF